MITLATQCPFDLAILKATYLQFLNLMSVYPMSFTFVANSTRKKTFDLFQTLSFNKLR